MCLVENKKVLFLVGREQEIDYGYVKQRYHILPEEIIILESDELDRIQPFGDLMRDILLNVYEKNIEEIFIVDTEEDRKNLENILGIIGKNIPTLNYIFTHCKPEFPDRTIKEWFEGKNILIDDRKNTIEVIRCHPLMPRSVKVTEV